MFLNLTYLSGVSIAFMIGAGINSKEVVHILSIVPIIISVVSYSVLNTLLAMNNFKFCPDIQWNLYCTGLPGSLGLLAGLPEFRKIWSGGKDFLLLIFLHFFHLMHIIQQHVQGRIVICSLYLVSW